MKDQEVNTEPTSGMVLIDTSAWSHFFNTARQIKPKIVAEISHLLKAELACYLAPVFLEQVTTCRSLDQFKAYQCFFANLPLAYLDNNAYAGAVQILQKLANNQSKYVCANDALQAVVAQRDHLVVFHNDVHFEEMAKVILYRQYRV